MAFDCAESAFNRCSTTPFFNSFRFSYLNFLLCSLADIPFDPRSVLISVQFSLQSQPQSLSSPFNKGVTIFQQQLLGQLYAPHIHHTYVHKPTSCITGKVAQHRNKTRNTDSKSADQWHSLRCKSFTIRMNLGFKALNYGLELITNVIFNQSIEQGKIRREESEVSSKSKPEL
jgi:hypothetical protein